MKQIRQNIFETNSSSSHVLSIASSIEPAHIDRTSLIPDANGNLVLPIGKFGYEFVSYNKASVKAIYVAILVHELEEYLKDYRKMKNGQSTPDKVEIIKNNSIYKWANDHYSQCRDNFKNAVKRQTKCRNVILDNVQKSYIDHNSSDEVKHFEFLLDEHTIRNFIFDTRSWLCTGSDSSDKTWEISPNKTPTLKDWK